MESKVVGSGGVELAKGMNGTLSGEDEKGRRKRRDRLTLMRREHNSLNERVRADAAK